MPSREEAVRGWVKVSGRYLQRGGPSRRGWHHAEDMLRCPQLWAYRNKLQLNFGTSPPLVKGILIHVGLAHYYKRLQLFQQGATQAEIDQYWDPVSAMQLIAAEEDAKLNEKGPDGFPVRTGARYAEFIELCIASVQAYMTHYRFDTFTIVDVESQFEAAIPAQEGVFANRDWPSAESTDLLNLDYTQSPDLIVQNSSGHFFIVDHKSRGRRDLRATRGYTMSGQFHGYQNFGRREWGDAFGGVLLNYITIGQKDGTKFERVQAEPKPWAIRAFADSIRWAEYQIAMFEEWGLDPWEYPKIFGENGNCETRYGPCPAQDLCGWGQAGPPRGDKWGLE